MKNDTDSFEEIAMPHLDTVYRAAVAMCSNRDDAEDLTQTTFLKAFEQFATYKKGTNCKAWLLSILRNKWIDMMRHKNSVGQVLQLDESIIVDQKQNNEIKYSNCEDLLANFSDEQIIKVLKSLPAEQRFALFLVDVEQLSHEDVAEIVNAPIGTVKSRKSRARATLRTKLFSYAKEMGFTGGQR
ncbi:MAG: RNA polymerase sigma factor [Planctomycetota bacterium]